MWIWQQNDWPNFEYDSEVVMPVLSDVISNVAPLVLLANELDQDKKLMLESKLLLDEALSSAKIEGEILDRDSVRSKWGRYLETLKLLLISCLNLSEAHQIL